MAISQQDRLIRIDDSRPAISLRSRTIPLKELGISRYTRYFSQHLIRLRYDIVDVPCVIYDFEAKAERLLPLWFCRQP